MGAARSSAAQGAVNCAEGNTCLVVPGDVPGPAPSRSSDRCKAQFRCPVAGAGCVTSGTLLESYEL